MKIWLINPHDAVPGEIWGHKHGMILADTLASAGHEVTYWAMNFSHVMKKFRCLGWAEKKIKDNLNIIFVPVNAYQRNVSLSRLLSLLQYARGLWKRGKIAPGPDCIIITIPTPFSDFVAVKLAQRHGAELITDFRDLWPELFTMVFPSKMRLLINVFLYPLYFLRKYAFNNSSAVTAVCETYLKLVHKICPQSANKPSEIIYSTTVQINNFQSMMGNNNGYKPVVKKESDDIWAIYAGTLGNNYDIESLLQASKLLMSDENGNKIKIVVAGDGPLKNRLEQFIEQDKITNLYYVGILNISQLCKYFAKSDIGLSIYAPDSTVVIPAKAFDYFAAQLPIVNSLNGEFADLIQREGLGVQYDAGNPQSLAEALISLAADEERRKSMVDRIGTIAPNFDRDLQYSKILHLLPSKNK